jgi:hypothetical protein
MSESDDDRTASLMTPAKLAQLKVRPAPAASPGAWLDQMAADAGSGHVRRLMDLRQQLEAQVRGREGDFRPMAEACQALQDALAQLDFSLVEPKGWLARATGKGKGAADAFGNQHGKVHGAGQDLAGELRSLQKRLGAKGTGLDRLVLEIDAEVRALDKIMDQGARWLQDMRNQLRTRQAAAADVAARKQIQEDTARCELLVARLKVLRAVTTSTQQVLETCKAANAGRASVLASLQQLVDEDWKAGQQKLASLARKVEDDGSASEGVERAARARESMQAALQQAAQDCAGVQAQDQGAADEVAALQATLQSAG